MFVYTLGKILNTYTLALIKLDVDKQFIKSYSNYIFDKTNAEYKLKKNSNAKIISIIDENNKNYLIGLIPCSRFLIQKSINDLIEHGIIIYLNKKRALSCYISSKYTGKSIQYFDSGEIESEINYLNGKLNGSALYWQILFNNNENIYTKLLKKQCEFKNNKLNGEYIEYIDGFIVKKCFYKLGKLHGKYLSFYNNGNIQSEYNYKNNNIHGIATQWFQNGSLYIEKSFTNGFLHGNYKEWNIDNIIVKHLIYKNGLIISNII